MKTYLFIVIGVLSMMLASCSGKYEEWHEPQGPSRPTPANVTFDADSVSSIDMRTGSGDSVRIFRPVITCDKPYTVTYNVTVFNASRTDSVSVKAYNGGRALRKQLQQALTWLFGPGEQQRNASMDIVADILVEGVIMRGKADSIPLVITPRRQELSAVWYIMGTHIGNGAWNFSPDAVYTCMIPMYANSENYSELLYAGYFPAGSQLRVVPQPGNENLYIGGGDETGGQSFQNENMEGDPLDNVIIGRAGYYKVIVDVSRPNDPAMRMERIEGTKTKVFGLMNWNSTEMTAVTTASGSENHDWLIGNLIIENDAQTDFNGSYTIPTDSTSVATTATLGGNAFPVGRTVPGAQGAPGQAGTYTVLLNDLTGAYRFIQQ